MSKIIFFGTSDFAVPALRMLVDKGYDVHDVVTTADKPAGRDKAMTQSPVKIAGVELGLNVIQPEKLLSKNIDDDEYDVGIVIAYGKIIPLDIIAIPKTGILNIHPSLLPKYRGPSPIQYALLNGEDKTGVTIMQIDDKLDHGPILIQKEYGMGNKLYKDLEVELAYIGAELLVGIIPQYLDGSLIPQEQDHDQATFSKMIKKEDGKIDWNKSAKEIFNQFRAFHVWPGVWTELGGKRVVILDCHPSDEEDLDIGKWKLIPNNELAVGTSQGVLKIAKLQMEGKNPSKASDFYNGNKKLLD